MAVRDDKAVALMRELRTAGQLQHAWITQSWQRSDGALHPAAIMLLSELHQHGEGRPSELAKRKMVDLSVISRQIAQLAAAGLIERRPAPEDGRASLIRISEAGIACLDEWREQHLAFVEHALSGWTDDEVDALTSRLNQMNEGMRGALAAVPR